MMRMMIRRLTAANYLAAFNSSPAISGLVSAFKGVWLLSVWRLLTALARCVLAAGTRGREFNQRADSDRARIVRGARRVKCIEDHIQ